MMQTRRDPLPLLRFALASRDEELAAVLIRRFAVSRTLSERALRELSGLRTRVALRPAARRTFDALVVLLGLDRDG